jgi:hypothetical protein
MKYILLIGTLFILVVGIFLVVKSQTSPPYTYSGNTKFINEENYFQFKEYISDINVRKDSEHHG